MSRFNKARRNKLPYEDIFTSRNIPLPTTPPPQNGASYAEWHQWVTDDVFYVNEEELSLVIDLWMGRVTV